ncbi:lysophospholipid acyltransferase family protein [Chloroflexota bacterium]
MSWFYYVARAILGLLFLLLTRWQVKGKENVPSQGPLLIVANHLNLTDPPLLGISFSRKVIFMAKEELFRSRFTAHFMRRLGAFPVRRQGLDRVALRQALQILDDGLVLAMFPEGMRSRNGQLGAALPGSALIACRSGAPILPVGITGTEQIKGIVWILRRPKVTVNIGHPFYLTPADGKLTRKELAVLTDSIMRHIAELLPQEYRGSYTP